MGTLKRRDFLKSTLAGLAMGSTIHAAQENGPGGLPTRPLGNTGERVSILCLGGHHAAVDSLTDDESISLMHEAIDEGLTFFDNCRHYNDGRSEVLMGKALATGGRRDKVFLMTKVCARDYETTKTQIDECLERLATDRIDLVQHHAIGFEDDPQRILDPDNGALRATREAKEAGKIRYIGFSGHAFPELMVEMLEGDYSWATCQMVLNVADAFDEEGFQKVALPEAVKRNVGVLAMKALGFGRLVASDVFGVDPEICRRYALSLPISSMVCGIDSRERLHQDLAIARNFKPVTEDELAQLPEAVKTAHEGGKTPGRNPRGCAWYGPRRNAEEDGDT